MKAQEKATMPRIEEFLRPPRSAGGEPNIEAAMRFLEDLLRPLMPGMDGWPRRRRSLKEGLRADFQAMRKAWGGEVLKAYTLKRDEAERHFQRHIEAGGKREEWTPWEALGVPQLMDWYLTQVNIHRSGQRPYKHSATAFLRPLADTLLDIGETDALIQFATVLCGGGSSETASG